MDVSRTSVTPKTAYGSSGTDGAYGNGPEMRLAAKAEFGGRERIAVWASRSLASHPLLTFLLAVSPLFLSAPRFVVADADALSAPSPAAVVLPLPQQKGEASRKVFYFREERVLVNPSQRLLRNQLLYILFLSLPS